MIAPMYYTLTPDCYKVTFQYHPMLVKCVKRIPSARYHADGNYWEVSSYHRQYLKLMEQWARSHSFVTSVLWLTDDEKVCTYEPLPMPTLNVPHNLLIEPYDFQKEGIAYAIEHKRCIMGDEQVLDLQSVVEELWQSFREETDFIVEAHALSEFRKNNLSCNYVTCPKPYPGLCTKHVVVMDYVEGIPISHTFALAEAGYDVAEIGRKLVYNYSSQMLDDGFFHADPHPGNIIVADGTIVYIDLGIMGRLSAHDRKALSDIVFAVGDMDTPRLKDALLRFSVTQNTSTMDHARLLSDLDAVVQDYGQASLGELDLAQFFNALLTLVRRNGIELPSSVTMLGRSLVTLEGTVDGMLADESMVDILERHIRSQTSLWGIAQEEAELYARETRLATHGLLRAASEASLAMNMLTRGQLRVNMDVGGSDDPIADFSHAFDRLTMGIVIAGLFIGSSIIYFAGVKPLVFGIPIVGFIGFMVAFILGVRLVVDILREGHRHK